MSQSSGHSLARLGLAPDFPVGMRVMAIDPDSESLNILKDLLIQCKFTVLPEQSAKNALKRVNDQNEDCQIVVTECYHDMDTFEFVRRMTRRAPVFVLSYFDDNKLVKKAIHAGAVDYKFKPATLEMMKPIWQHVVKRMLNKNVLERITPNPNPNPNLMLIERGTLSNDHTETESESDSSQQKDQCGGCGSNIVKKARISWVEKGLHILFLRALRQLGGAYVAKPKDIWLNMKLTFPWLTRSHVSSHLQKFKLFLEGKLKVRPAWADLTEDDDDKVGSSQMPRTSSGFENLQMATAPTGFENLQTPIAPNGVENGQIRTIPFEVRINPIQTMPNGVGNMQMARLGNGVQTMQPKRIYGPGNCWQMATSSNEAGNLQTTTPSTGVENLQIRTIPTEVRINPIQKMPDGVGNMEMASLGKNRLLERIFGAQNCWEKASSSNGVGNMQQMVPFLPSASNNVENTSESYSHGYYNYSLHGSINPPYVLSPTISHSQSFNEVASGNSNEPRWRLQQKYEGVPTYILPPTALAPAPAPTPDQGKNRHLERIFGAQNCCEMASSSNGVGNMQQMVPFPPSASNSAETISDSYSHGYYSSLHGSTNPPYVLSPTISHSQSFNEVASEHSNESRWRLQQQYEGVPAYILPPPASAPAPARTKVIDDLNLLVART